MNQTNFKSLLRHMVYAAVCLALCMVLPFLTGQIPQIGSALSPMHIPVLLAGFLCGPWWAALVGLIAPVLRSLLFSSPALYPMATAMSFELAAYGACSGALYRLLPKELAAEGFVELESDSQEMLINGFSNTELKEVLDELYLDDAVDIVEEMPASVVIRILDKATPEMRKSINEILQYPEDSAGSIMNMEFLSLKKDMTVEDAFKRIRRIGGELETINILYVTDPTRHLQGVLSVRDLLLADEDDRIEDIMDPNVVSVMTLDDKEDVAQAMGKYDYLAMPVVDQENRLIGIVTVDDAMDVIEEETTEDFEKMAAMLPSDKPYLKTSIFSTWKARIPWLMVLMLSATFTGMILNHYESKLAACLVLNSYIPMLSGTGGNSGTQASVAVIRALSLDEVDFSDLFQVLWKELRVSFLCGVCLAAANFVKMLLVDRMLLGNDTVNFTICTVVCLTILFVVIFAKCVGCCLPLLAEKVGLDPAVMASPFISTIVDATSLLIYFALASALIPALHTI